MSRTIGDALAELFPEGTGKNATYDEPPAFPPSIFGAVAYLLERGGVYHKIVSEDLAMPSKTPIEQANTSTLVVRKSDVAECCELGRAWLRHTQHLVELASKLAEAKGKPEKDRLSKLVDDSFRHFEENTGKQIRKLWDDLTFLHREHVLSDKPSKWWLPALKLLIISDEASVDLGYATGSPFEAFLRLYADWNQLIPINNEKFHFLRDRTQQPFETKLNSNIVRVVPKSRTPTVGCTMRTLSHNLAIVPPEGIVRINWFRSPIFEKEVAPLNLLLVPFPFEVSSLDFSPLIHTRDAASKTAGHQKTAKHKGMFEVQQMWLRNGAQQSVAQSSPEQIASFINALVDTAAADCGRVHGVVLPELALDWPTFAAIVRRFTGPSRARQNLELLVAGISSLPDGTKGNFAVTTTFANGQRNARYAFSHMRAKHHRWQLNSSQITDYALGATLDPNSLWWEGIGIPPREIDLSVLRGSSVFTAMICEDLARSEPCHEPLRSVGPNLVFVLLMDGAQLPSRWPARYATALADDPGSSVLTLTSLGLMHRTNNTCRYSPPSRHIAIWKDDTGGTVQIECPRDSHAVLLTIVGEQAEESTIDGRPNWDAQAWRYRGHQPVALARTLVQKNKWEWIVR